MGCDGAIEVISQLLPHLAQICEYGAIASWVTSLVLIQFLLFHRKEGVSPFVIGNPFVLFAGHDKFTNCGNKVRQRAIYCLAVFIGLGLLAATLSAFC